MTLEDHFSIVEPDKREGLIEGFETLKMDGFWREKAVKILGFTEIGKMRKKGCCDELKLTLFTVSNSEERLGQ